jgi:hypothetical protein
VELTLDGEANYTDFDRRHTWYLCLKSGMLMRRNVMP